MSTINRCRSRRWPGACRPRRFGQAGSLALVGGLVVDGTGRAPIENGVVLVKGNRIAAVGRRGELSIPADAEVIDVSGKAVLPGLIDMHVHLNDGSAVPLSLFVSAGVTSVRDVGNFTRVVKRLAEQNRAPRIFYYVMPDRYMARMRYFLVKRPRPLLVCTLIRLPSIIAY